MMNIDADGRKLIRDFEGCVLHAYLCPAGVLTIGAGHTTGVVAGMTITEDEADALLAEDLDRYSQFVRGALEGRPTSQHEFNALGSLAFNIGIGGLQQSTVLRLHKAGDKQGASRAFGLWNKATVGGVLQAVPGLTRRRAAEAAHYLTPDDPAAVEPMPQAVAPPPPIPAGFAETPTGNVIREDVSASPIVKGADLGTKVATVAGTAAAAAPVVTAAAGMDWKAMLGVAAVMLAGALAFTVYKLVQAKTARIEMYDRGIA